MKKNSTLLTCLLLLLTFQFAGAITYTSTGNGNWGTAARWTPSGPPTSGSNATNKNIIIIQAGHTITIPGDLIALSNVVIYVYGTLNMDNSGFDYANLNITGTGSGLIIAVGGRVIESSLLDNYLNIRVNGTVVWNGSSDGNTTATTGTGQIFLPVGVNNPLPIVLLSWSVEETQENILAHWTTSSEQNNHYFTIEESDNGTDFYTIAQINSYGNSSALQNYSHSFSSTGKSTAYYRLKQTDYDGSYSYSAVVKITSASTNETWNIYPNPITQQEFFVQTNYKGLSHISLLDSKSGLEIFREDLSIANNDVIKIALPDQVKAGYYVLTIQHEGGVETKPVVVY